jgi:hypothetical protein
MVASQFERSMELGRTLLVVPAVCLVTGAAAASFDARLGILTLAVILGWTQLVGL